MSFSFQTIIHNSEAEFSDRGSRFIAYTFQVTQASDIKSALHKLKDLHPKAVHHCYAWRLGFDKTQYRANDDGEPSGSAGRPILGQIDSLQLTQVLVVVVRYFGGTLLGVPGLINAYKTVTQQALIRSGIETRQRKTAYRLQFDYTLMNAVMQVIKNCQLEISAQQMALFCAMDIRIAKREEQNVLERLHNIHGLHCEPIPDLIA